MGLIVPLSKRMTVPMSNGATRRSNDDCQGPVGVKGCDAETVTGRTVPARIELLRDNSKGEVDASASPAEILPTETVAVSTETCSLPSIMAETASKLVSSSLRNSTPTWTELPILMRFLGLGRNSSLGVRLMA